MRIRYQVRKADDGTLVGWDADDQGALIKARWNADRFGDDYIVVRLSDGVTVYRCNAAGDDAT